MQNFRTVFWGAVGVFILFVGGFLFLIRWSGDIPIPPSSVPSGLPPIGDAVGHSGGSSGTAPVPQPFGFSAPSASGAPAISQTPLFTGIPQTLRDAADQFGVLAPPPRGGLSIFQNPFSLPVVAPPPPSLSEKEIFDRIWVPSYIGYLRHVEALDLKRSGLLVPSEERTVTFATDADVYHSLNVILKNFHRMGWVNDQQFAQLTNALTNTIPPLVEQERALLRSGKTSDAVLPGRQRIASTRTERDFAQALIDGLGYAFSFAPDANASWVTYGDCYKDDAPKYPVLGFTQPVYCCNCGIRCDGYDCYYLDDCGTYGAACDEQLGCLNNICQSWPNAIWDAYWYPDSTLECGCG